MKRLAILAATCAAIAVPALVIPATAGAASISGGGCTVTPGAPYQYGSNDVFWVAVGCNGNQRVDVYYQPQTYWPGWGGYGYNTSCRVYGAGTCYEVYPLRPGTAWYRTYVFKAYVNSAGIAGGGGVSGDWQLATG